MKHEPAIMVNGRRYINLISAAPRMNLSISRVSRLVRRHPDKFHLQEIRSLVSGRVTHLYLRESDVEAWAKEAAARPLTRKAIKDRLKQFYDGLTHRPTSTTELLAWFRQATGLEATLHAARALMANKRPWTKNVVKWMEQQPRLRELPIERLQREAEKEFRTTFNVDQIKFARKRYDALHKAVWAKEHGAQTLAAYAQALGIPYAKVYKKAQQGHLPIEKRFSTVWVMPDKSEATR